MKYSTDMWQTCFRRYCPARVYIKNGYASHPYEYRNAAIWNWCKAWHYAHMLSLPHTRARAPYFQMKRAPFSRKSNALAWTTTNKTLTYVHEQRLASLTTVLSSDLIWHARARRVWRKQDNHACMASRSFPIHTFRCVVCPPIQSPTHSSRPIQSRACSCCSLHTVSRRALDIISSIFLERLGWSDWSHASRNVVDRGRCA